MKIRSGFVSNSSSSSFILVLDKATPEQLVLLKMGVELHNAQAHDGYLRISKSGKFIFGKLDYHASFCDYEKMGLEYEID